MVFIDSLKEVFIGWLTETYGRPEKAFISSLKKGLYRQSKGSHYKRSEGALKRYLQTVRIRLYRRAEGFFINGLQALCSGLLRQSKYGLYRRAKGGLYGRPEGGPKSPLLTV